MQAIEISEFISIPMNEIQLEFVRAGGPGGQKVNKTSSAVVLRFNVKDSPSLPEEVKERLRELSGSLLTREGILVIHARNHRSQNLNRKSAIQRLIKLIRKAATKRRSRKRTTPTLASRQSRLMEKKKRSDIKQRRRYEPGDDELP